MNKDDKSNELNFGSVNEDQDDDDIEEYEFKITSDVPVPESRRSTRKGKYPFAKMNVGDSFFVPVMKDEKAEVVRSRVGSAALMFRRSHDLKIKFISRGVTNGLRYWRVE